MNKENNHAVCQFTSTSATTPFVLIPHRISPFQVSFPHYHSCVELSYVKEGEITFFTSEEMQVLHKGQVSLANSMEVHYSFPHFKVSSEELAGITLQIDYAFLSQYISGLDEYRFDIKKPDVNRKIGILMNELIQIRDGNIFLCHAKCLEICAVLTGCLVQKNYEQNTFIQEVLKYTETHYYEDINEQVVADCFGYSREHFSRLFKEAAHMSYALYLRRFRLIRSQELLLHTSKSIRDVAIACGFSSDSAFSQGFSKAYHISPAEFRKKCVTNVKNEPHNP